MTHKRKIKNIVKYNSNILMYNKLIDFRFLKKYFQAIEPKQNLLDFAYFKK